MTSQSRIVRDAPRENPLVHNEGPLNENVQTGPNRSGRLQVIVEEGKGRKGMRHRPENVIL